MPKRRCFGLYASTLEKFIYTYLVLFNFEQTFVNQIGTIHVVCTQNFSKS